MIKTVRQFIKTHYVVLVLLVVSGFLRLYNLQDSLQFQGDQGRDAILVSRIFKEADLVFIGPVTSVGNMYLGPLYYYFMLPFQFLTYPNPIGPAVGVALLGIATSILLYTLGTKIVGQKAALIAAMLYTFSAIAVTYNRFSWNPNPAPLVSLLLLSSLLAAIKNPKKWWLVGLWVTVIVQLHYLTLLAVGAAGLIWLWQVYLRLRSRQSLRELWFGTALAACIFVFSLTPLALFDLKHNGLNSKAFLQLLSGDTFETTTTKTWYEKAWVYVKETDGRSQHILAEHAIGKNRPINRLVVVLTILAVWLIFRFGRWRTEHPGLAVLVVYIAVGIIGTSLYQHSVFDHYIAYLFPAVFLLHGTTLSYLFKSKLTQFGLFLLAVAYVSYNLPRLPLKSVGWTITDIWETSNTISERVKPGEKYNIVLLSESKDLEGQNYRYFLTTKPGKAPVPTELRPEVDTLFIIDEMKKTPDVTSLPIYEIVTFPNKIVSETYQIPDGPQITVLRR